MSDNNFEKWFSAELKVALLNKNFDWHYSAQLNKYRYEAGWNAALKSLDNRQADGVVCFDAIGDQQVTAIKWLGEYTPKQGDKIFAHAMPKSEDKVISNDDKLPVDVRIAGGTVGKGCKFETLLIRINAFNQFYDENLVDKEAQRKARENLLALITPQPSTDVSELVQALKEADEMIGIEPFEHVAQEAAEAHENIRALIAKHTVK